MPKRKYWYRFFIGECPVCGRDQSSKVKMYTKKPKDIKKRYIQLNQNECYDFCLERQPLRFL